MLVREERILEGFLIPGVPMNKTGDVLGGGGFHHVAIRAKDFDASEKFWTEVMGLKPVVRWGENQGRAVMLDMGDGARLEIFANGVEMDRPEPVILHFCLKTSRVDEVTERVRKAGMKISLEPKDVNIANGQMKARISFFNGPDNELVELFQEK